jgi:hypothetical protein
MGLPPQKKTFFLPHGLAPSKKTRLPVNSTISIYNLIKKTTTSLHGQNAIYGNVFTFDGRWLGTRMGSVAGQR